MKGSRLLVLALLAAVVVALVWSFDGRPVATDQGLEAPVVPAAAEPDSSSSTWFCAAGGVITGDAQRHDLFLWNPAGAEATALLSAYDGKGRVGERLVEVTTPGPTEVDVNALFGASGLSVMVESTAGDLVVEHRIIGRTFADQVPCATHASDRWYFPAMTSVRNTAAQLVLFNPFSLDASVDISATVGDGVRRPPEWQGLVVPSGTARSIDLGVGAQRRDQFAISVEARNGRVVAETTQLLATPKAGDAAATRGARLQLGVPRAQADWVFAEGFTGPGASERLVLFNPGDEPASALVQVTPFGAADLPPEPFELEVPPRRFAQLDLSAETRIPPEGLHAIRVETDPGTPLVAGRVVTVVGPRQDPSVAEIVARPPVTLGTSIGTGTPVAAALWVATGVVVGGRQESVIAVHNPSSRSVRFTATVLGGQADGKRLADEVEVAAGDSIAVRTRDQGLGGNEVTVLVEATAPVVVERTITYFNQNDLAMGLAVPLPDQRLRLTPVGR